MNITQSLKAVLTITAVCAASSAFSATMSKAEYNTAIDRISADYKAEKAVCSSSSGNAKDICKEQAKGKEKVSRAELEYKYSGKAGDANKVAVAKADSEFAIAKEVCDDKTGNAKSLCRTEAKSAHKKALASAKMTEKVGDAKTDAAAETREADYKVAVEKCESLAGDTKTSCINAAKARFNKS
jgi:hypothetical protein